MNVGCDEALRGAPASLLLSASEALLAQEIDGGLDIAADLLQSLLAVHHAGPSLLTQILDSLHRPGVRLLSKDSFRLP